MKHPDLVVDFGDMLKLVRVDTFSSGWGGSCWILITFFKFSVALMQQFDLEQFDVLLFVFTHAFRLFTRGTEALRLLITFANSETSIVMPIWIHETVLVRDIVLETLRIFSLVVDVVFTIKHIVVSLS